MFSFCFVSSGSKGNASIFYDGESLIQIDMGISLKTLRKGLALYNKDIEDIDACFITHEHADHVKGVPLFKGKIPVYASKGTLKDIREIYPGEGMEIGKFTLIPFSVSHDAANPVNYLIMHEGIRFAYVTDTGYVPEEAYPLLKNCDYYLFESNHDIKMLRSSSRPASLKNRIKGKQGHLSNLQAAEALSELIGENTKAIYLAHLSEECNEEEIALATFEKIFKKEGIAFPMDKIFCAKQWEMVSGEAK